MQAKIVIQPSGKISIFTQDGTFEAGQAAIDRILASLKTVGVPLDQVGQVEQHRHEDQKVEAHTHAHA